ncbi:hypothetical protein AB6813_01510 [bacterium RCC_150]
MSFTFPAMVAYDSSGNKPVKQVSFQVYAVTDTAFTTPLAITDTFGAALPGNILNSGTQGVFPQFKQATNSTVVITDASRVYAWTVNCVQQDTATAAFINDSTTATAAALNATYARFTQLARNPDLIISGAITRDTNGAATSAPVVWPDGTVGTYTADTLSTAFPGSVDGYHITYGSPATHTYTQPTITRDSTGAASNIPQIVVS